MVSCVLGSAEVGDGDCEDPQVYESMCNIHTGSCEAAPASELGKVCLATHGKGVPGLCDDVRNGSAAADVAAQSVVVPEEMQDEDVDEDIYEYDCPRAAAPPPPTRRNLSDISGPSAAFGALSIDSLETSRCQHLHTSALDPDSVFVPHQRLFIFSY